MSKYLSLKNISTIYKLLAVIVFFGGFIIGIAAALGILVDSAAIAAIAILILAWSVSVICAIMMLATTKIINVLIDIEENNQWDNNQ